MSLFPEGYRMKYFFFISALAVFTVSNSVMADTTIHFKNTDDSMPDALHIKDGVAMLKDPKGRGRMVFDTNKEQLLMINDQRKEYIVINEAYLEQMGSMMQQQMDIMLAALPPEQQKMMKEQMNQAMGGDKPVEYNVKKTGKSAKVNGIECEQHTILENAQAVAEACIADASHSGMNKADFATLQKMATLSEKFTQKAAKSAGPLARGLPKGSSFGAIQGLPVEIKQLQNGNVTTVTSVENTQLDPQLFSAAGAKQTDPLQQLQQMRQQPSAR
jgi:hypothetical protein